MANDNTTQQEALPDDGPWSWDATKLSQAAGNTFQQVVSNANAGVADVDAPWALSADQLSAVTKNQFPELPAIKPQTPATAPQSMGDIFNKLVQVESGGKHITNGQLTTSNKGAQGITQVLPKTGDNPGFGVTPIQNNSKEEYLRFGSDYLKAITNYFGGDERKGVAAYNAGPSAVQKAVATAQQSGGDWLSFLPKETKNYVTKILGNGLAAITGSSNANAAADFRPYLASNKIETGATVGPNGKPDGGKFVSQSNALGQAVVSAIQKDFPDHIDAINTKITADQPAAGSVADYGGLGGDKINLGKIIGSNTEWFDKTGKASKSNQSVDKNTVNDALGITLHEIQHARMSNIGTFNDGLGKDWKGMLDDAAKADFPSVSQQGTRNGDELNEFLATATTIKEMQRKGYQPTGRFAEAAKALPDMEKKYPWLKQYVINYIYPEAENSGKNVPEVAKNRKLK